jgi:hypothetical protein
VTLKAKVSNDDDSETSTDDDVALMVKKFKKFMRKNGYQGGSSESGKSYSKNPFAKKKCFKCGEIGHIIGAHKTPISCANMPSKCIK